MIHKRDGNKCHNNNKHKETYQISTGHSQGQITFLIWPRKIELIKINIQLKFDTTARASIITNTLSVG